MSGVAAIIGDAWRIAFLTAGAPVVGSVLLLAKVIRSFSPALVVH